MNDNPIADHVRSRPYGVLPNGEPIVINNYKDLLIEAEKHGINNLEREYRRIRKKIGRVMVELTALNVVINWLSWDHYEHGDSDLARWYADKHNEMRLEILKDKTWSKQEMTYYIRTTD